MRLKSVGVCAFRAADREALRPVARRHVGIELPTRRELLLRIVRVPALPVVDVEVDVVRVRLPDEDEAKARLCLFLSARLTQLRADLAAASGLRTHPCRGDEPHVLF